MKVCKKCNLKYGENDNFCKECGDILEECSSVSYFFISPQSIKKAGILISAYQTLFASYIDCLIKISPQL